MESTVFFKQVSKVLVTNEKNPALKKLADVAKRIEKDLGGPRSAMLIKALKSDANNLLEFIENTVTEKDMVGILTTPGKFEKFLSSDYISGCLNSYEQQIIANKHFQLIDKDFTIPVPGAKRKKWKCVISGVEEPMWKCILWGIALVAICVVIVAAAL
jgi:hypothetical protein